MSVFVAVNRSSGIELSDSSSPESSSFNELPDEDESSEEKELFEADACDGWC